MARAALPYLLELRFSCDFQCLKRAELQYEGRLLAGAVLHGRGYLT